MPSQKIQKLFVSAANPCFLLALICLAVAGLYLGSLDLKLYADDFAIWNTVKQMPGLASLFTTTYVPEFYRPFELALIRMNISQFGFHSTFYHLVALSGHILVCLLLYLLGLRLGFSRPSALLASLFFGLAHVNAISVMSNDAAGQIFSAGLGVLAMILLLTPKEIQFRHGVLAGCLLFFLLLWKDSGVAYGLTGAIILGFRLLPKGEGRRLLQLLVPILIAIGLYTVIRHLVGIQSPDFGPEGRYQFWLGFNVIKNVVYLFAAMLTPVGTTILLAHRHDPLFISVTALGILADLAVFGIGFALYLKRSNGNWRGLALPILLLLALLTPGCFLNHVSEMYAYKPFALFALLFAGSLVEMNSWVAKKGFFFRVLVILFVILTLACHVVSVKHKEHLMRHNGRVAEWMLQEIKSQVPGIPAGAPVLVSNLDPGPDLIYSVFFMYGVTVLGGGGFIEMLYGHKPVEYRYVPPSQLKLRLADLREPTLVITYGQRTITARLLEESADTLWF